MILVGITGGLGSQMFKYAFYLDIVEKYKNCDCYIDVSSYDFLESWNGYELEKLFDIKEVFFKTIKKTSEIDHREFVIKSLLEMGEDEIIWYCNGKRKIITSCKNNKESLLIEQFNKLLWFINNQIIRNIYHKSEQYPANYLNETKSVYFDEFEHKSEKYILHDKERLRRIFSFPEINVCDEKNYLLMNKITNPLCESVAVHVRRSDHMYDCGKLFKNRYYSKAVSYIKSICSNPEFYIFSEDSEWCRRNMNILGICEQDKYIIVDWNIGDRSYIDMQLMTMCKHNVLNYSTFSWWGYYLSNRQGKIVTTPKDMWEGESMYRI